MILSYLIISCNDGKKANEIGISFQKPEIVTDSLFMAMPGMVYYVNNNIIIEDAFASDFFYKVHNSLGKFIKNIAPKGNSSNEFLMPHLTRLINDDIIISDINRGNAILYQKSIDSAYQYNEINPNLIKNNSLLNIDENVYITLNNSFKGEIEEGLFNIYSNGIFTKSFGEFPIKNKIQNRFEIYQGFLEYNKNNKMLVFFSYLIPYYAIYKRNADSFELVKEETYGKFNHNIIDQNLKINNVEGEIVRTVALLKDYIVTVGNTADDLNDIPKNSNIERDFNQLSRSLFIYDYNYNLKKIISLKMPILRVVSDVNSNLLYLINYIDGEFNLSKLNIE